MGLSTKLNTIVIPMKNVDNAEELPVLEKEKSKKKALSL